MFKLAIEVCSENHFGLIHAIFQSLGSTKSVYFFGTPGIIQVLIGQNSDRIALKFGCECACGRSLYGQSHNALILSRNC